MKLFRLLVLFTTVVFITSCQSDDFKDYYFQLENFTTTQVYKFECKERDIVDYWEMTYFDDEKALYTKVYNKQLEETYFIKEEIRGEGVYGTTIGKSTLSEDGREIVSLGTIQKSDYFLWEHKGPYSYKVTLDSPDESPRMVERQRTFVDYTTVTIMNEEYDAIKFEDKFITTNLITDEVSSYTNYTYYAEGLGCVKIEMWTSDGSYHDLVLTEILSGTEWGVLLKQH